MQIKVTKRKTKQGVINGAIKLLSNKDHWGQGANGQTAQGQVVNVDDPKAVVFCLQGAIQKCSINDDKLVNAILACIDDVATREKGYGIISVNDNDGYEAVMELLNKSKKVCK